MSGNIAVIDYRMGNLRSVEKALQVCGGRTKLTSSARDIESCSKVVFPGVGAFGDAMRELKKLGLDRAIKESIASGKPFLGLCLGMQLLFERSQEAPGVRGLAVLEGEVRRFPDSKLKVPHMGWNNIAKGPGTGTNRILASVPDNSYMYFVHSYYVVPKERDVILTVTDYGRKFASGIAKDNIYGLQFHPEKSQETGLKILRNFICL